MIRDIAKRSHVSTATISRVLNDDESPMLQQRHQVRYRNRVKDL